MKNIKNTIKEIIIFLLLLVSIALLLGIIFYDYIPTSKTVPSKVVPYQLPESISEELKSSEAEGGNIIKTYSIDSSDLKQYEYTDQYDKGKVNPFEKFSEATTGNETETGTNVNPNTNTSGNTNTTKTNSVGNFFDDDGK